ncbi:hypothetical protein L1N85_05605 [Paenibacillus alkaliterrae]|uniref:hypothetical protein n=1 Tax=Paenibacillus alkaliterrae TaxID=320909 RepID=UPI001F45A73D|nr:hypothetical protein [Paenibacillus alkaliterrae]MCF2937902.1 hypothetical protein [Paenibacillus alkaliterrae]
MRFTVQYIPLSKIKPGLTAKMTAHIRKLRKSMWDCMNLLVVRKNRNDGSYIILLGNDRYDFLRKHTKNIAAPCLVDESKPKARLKSWLYSFQWKRRTSRLSDRQPSRKASVTLSIVNDFLKEEPRFKALTFKQKFQVLKLAVRYKKTVIVSMKEKVDDML